ncbi:hypothetical protein [Streptantibioticus cattleyicolor]|uniref:Uncharacterized protein n=1 Tax=Streptantibioticus cattleyicolor (strain ATCC 35852 / DSM 46488 / JCM 4925 / NBRC 14057 / NRRL 8057) TaxID=1003195 RepID=F8JN51_STREN|nr:hypothetical protein [Streptantibioticus cattleyicolor]AEW99197.1 hypothetical protein SCATT_p10040 [Streptantibioticus cattleyicolor NRRL 8057 = DSM 46488]CCB71759.1 conserved protein of unknown function [Streptantibioticus cattleyicolor NRRL 8057 = DSM 46488]
MGGTRVMVLTTLVGSAEVWQDPFAVDAKAQHDVCTGWAAERGYQVAEWVICSNQPTDKAVERIGQVDVVVAASPRLLDLAVADVGGFTAACRSAGVRVETVEYPDPSYTEAEREDLYWSLQIGRRP